MSTEPSAEPLAESFTDLRRAVEAILFIADEPLNEVDLASSLSRPRQEVRAAIESLVNRYADATEFAFELREVGGGWRFYLHSEYDRVVFEHVDNQRTTKLSPAALETLSVIAYLQPIARSQIASIRAVNVDSVVRTLLLRGLIVEHDTDAETGAIRYATSLLFLTSLGLSSLTELPPIAPLLDDGSAGFDRD